MLVLCPFVRPGGGVIFLPSFFIILLPPAIPLCMDRGGAPVKASGRPRGIPRATRNDLQGDREKPDREGGNMLHSSQDRLSVISHRNICVAVETSS